ncbi:MAG: transglutaminase protein [Chlorobi bacterium]|nr:transglutaminase protein [Chlorobiota bacterium]
MCLSEHSFGNTDRWNWDGDEIIHECIIPSSRPIPGVHPTREYDIDVREFMVSKNNEVMNRALREKLRAYVTERMADGWDFFNSRSDGAFDFRASMVAGFVSDTINYKSRRVRKNGPRDPWLFPDETLTATEGDCEDRAILIASLMLCSGISGYNIRIAVGNVKVVENGREHLFDHMWVMYKMESGHWTVIEPLVVHAAEIQLRDGEEMDAPAGRTYADYIPSFVFNDAHLWCIRPQRETASMQTGDWKGMIMKSWKTMNPRFGGEVHKTILNEALCGLGGSAQWALDGLNRHFRRILFLSPIVDDVDNLFRTSYNPLDHFDNGLIDESWARVGERLAGFRSNNRARLDDFAFAAHAISDFYSHTSYLHFAAINNPGDALAHAEPYDPRTGSLPPGTIVYDAPSKFDLGSGHFSINPKWRKPLTDIPRLWNGRIISGRYGQKGDSHGIFEGISYIPDSIENDKRFEEKWSLPHHNQLAVDGPAPDAQHALYTTGNSGPLDRHSYANQYRWRRNTAVLHVRKAFLENWNSTPLAWARPAALAEVTACMRA